jgi:hypothetical protein
MARDFYHQIVREALEADGWTITADPFVIKSIGLRFTSQKESSNGY